MFAKVLKEIKSTRDVRLLLKLSIRIYESTVIFNTEHSRTMYRFIHKPVQVYS